MDGARLHALIYKGRGKAAEHIGLACNQFRPISAFAPLTNQVGTINAAFNASNPAYERANLYGKAIWYADLDGRQTQAGDYLVRATDGLIWFIAGQQQLLPIVAIDCNRTVFIQRQAQQTQVGQLPYSGVIAPADILGTASTPWPASILLGGRALPNAGLPADVRDAGWRILLPVSVPVTLASGDFVQDDQGKRYAIESAELTDLGWRLGAAEVHT